MPAATRSTPRGAAAPRPAVPTAGSEVPEQPNAFDGETSDDPIAQDLDGNNSDAEESYEDAEDLMDLRSALAIWKNACSAIDSFDGSEKWYLDHWLARFEKDMEITIGKRLSEAIRERELLSAVRSRLEGKAALLVKDVNDWTELKGRLRQQYRPDLAQRLLESQVHRPEFWRGRTIEDIHRSGLQYYSVMPTSGMATGIIDAARRRLPFHFRHMLRPDVDLHAAMSIVADLVSSFSGWDESPAWLTATTDRPSAAAVLATNEVTPQAPALAKAVAQGPGTSHANTPRSGKRPSTGQRRQRRMEALRRDVDELRARLDQESFGNGQ